MPNIRAPHFHFNITIILRTAYYSVPLQPVTADHPHASKLFRPALKSYQQQTKINLPADPFTYQLQTCKTVSAILAVFQDQVRDFDESRIVDERSRKWLIPTER